MFPSSSSASSADEGEAAATASYQDPKPRTEEVPVWTSLYSLSMKPRRKVKNSQGREESLFSLKEFLKNDNQSANHQFAGARPKIYEPQSRTPEPSENHDTAKYTRNPTELPDFVQDHLVIEQCYLGDKANSSLSSVEVDNLPDFALNSVEKKHKCYVDDQWLKNSKVGDHSFDLTDNLEKSPVLNPSHSNAFDLPKIGAQDNNINNYDSPNVGINDGKSNNDPESFDFQVPRSETSSNPDGTINNPNSIKLLPDFLSDAPIRSRATPPPNRPDCSCSNDSMNHWLSAENERLYSELQIARRQANERLLSIEALEVELLSRRQLDHTENTNLEKAMEQLKDNLKRSRKRAISAESTVESLRKELDSLSMVITMLRTENKELKAAIGSENNSYKNTTDRRMQRLADDLKLAASTAEVSLRQLMSGVSNLRALALTLETVDKVEDHTKDFLTDFDEDNAAGPAL